MFLPHYDIYNVSITEQTTAKCYLFVLYNKVEIFAKILSFAMPQKDFCTLFDVIMIHTKQSMPLAVYNSEMAVIGLSLKQHQLSICPLIDHGSQTIKSWNDLWLLHNIVIIYCSMVSFGLIWYCIISYGIIWYCIIWYPIVWYDIVRYGMVSYHIALYCTVSEYSNFATATKTTELTQM